MLASSAAICATTAASAPTIVPPHKSLSLKSATRRALLTTMAACLEMMGILCSEQNELLLFDKQKVSTSATTSSGTVA